MIEIYNLAWNYKRQRELQIEIEEKREEHAKLRDEVDPLIHKIETVVSKDDPKKVYRWENNIVTVTWDSGEVDVDVSVAEAIDPRDYEDEE